jgi:hypothetical protein
MANNNNASDDGLPRTPASLIGSPPAAGSDRVSNVIDFSESMGTAASISDTYPFYRLLQRMEKKGAELDSSIEQVTARYGGISP